jgi:hypothetical protein
MRLSIDFSALERAVRQMGADDIDTDFKLQEEIAPLAAIDIELGIGKEVVLEDVEISNGLLSYHGRQVLLYIQDHGNFIQAALENGIKGNKFHVADCTALQTMRRKKRFERYVATNDLSENFHITGKVYATGNIIEGDARLRVCKFCLNKLNYQGYKYGRKSAIFANFSIEDFFSTYSSFFPHMPSRLAGTNDADYTPDWREVSTRYKSIKHFKCESCNVDLSSNKSLLHTHHLNGVKIDNNANNLRALCVDCHRKQPLHEHMFVSHKDMQTINSLRRRQGLTKNSDWNRIRELADPATLGVIELCRYKALRLPEVGYNLRNNHNEIIATLELAWPSDRLGVAISSEDILAAKSIGWRVTSVNDAIENWA